jgi:diguanylate cyclase (GGDEF)-like protein
VKSIVPMLGERRQDPVWAWVLSCLGIVLALAMFEASADSGLTLAPLYAIPIFLATWFAGLSRGLAVALAALAAWLWLHHPHGGGTVSAPFAGNVLVRATAYIAVTLLVAATRSFIWQSLPRFIGPVHLSGVLTASQFREMAASELARANQDARPLSCAYLEVEGFKRVIELRGPLMATAILTVLGRCLHRSLRRIDIIGRLGPERFLILLPDTTEAESSAVLARLRTQFMRATQSCPVAVDLTIIVLSYSISPARFDDLIHDVSEVVISKRPSRN